MASIVSAGTTTATGLNFSADTSGVLQLASNNGTTAVTVDASQNVGIGTSSLSYKFEVQGSANTYFGQRIYNTNSGSSAVSYLQIGNNTNGAAAQLGLNSNANTTNFGGANALYLSNGLSAPIAFATSNVEQMRIDASGNVMIGTTTPRQILTVAQNSSTGMSLEILNLNTGNNTTKYAQLNFSGYDTVGTYKGTGLITTGPSGANYIDSYMAFSTRISDVIAERMRIDSSGNLLVGDTTAVAGRAQISNLVNAGTEQALRTRLGSGCNNTTSYHLVASTGGSDKLYIYGNGNVVNSNNSYGALSDIKLKENIVDATPKLEKINQIRIVNYNIIGDEQKQIGVIAQELEQVFPGMVEESPDLDKEGNNLGTATKSVKYSVFVPMLIKAIQEQQALITQLQADVAALKGAA